MNSLIVLSTLSAIFGYSLACTCFPPTQQTTWCSAEWISKVTVRGRTQNATDIHYVVSHDEVFKGPQNLSTSVFSSSQSAACGDTSLQVGRSYLLAGFNDSGTLSINHCVTMPVDDNQALFAAPEWSSITSSLVMKMRNKNFLACPVLAGQQAGALEVAPVLIQGA